MLIFSLGHINTLNPNYNSASSTEKWLNGTSLQLRVLQTWTTWSNLVKPRLGEKLYVVVSRIRGCYLSPAVGRYAKDSAAGGTFATDEICGRHDELAFLEQEKYRMRLDLRLRATKRHHNLFAT